MKESGYTYASPLGAGSDVAGLSPGTTATPAEIKVAVTDVACKERTNLFGVWFAVKVKHEKQAIVQKLQDLATIRTQWTDAARNATPLLDVPAPTHS
jgi:hypothetical protein